MDLFISYSHKDRTWKDRIVTFMHCMKVNGHFEYATWDWYCSKALHPDPTQLKQELLALIDRGSSTGNSIPTV